MPIDTTDRRPSEQAAPQTLAIKRCVHIINGLSVETLGGMGQQQGRKMATREGEANPPLLHVTCSSSRRLGWASPTSGCKMVAAIEQTVKKCDQSWREMENKHNRIAATRAVWGHEALSVHAYVGHPFARDFPKSEMPNSMHL